MAKSTKWESYELKSREEGDAAWEEKYPTSGSNKVTEIYSRSPIQTIGTG